MNAFINEAIYNKAVSLDAMIMALELMKIHGKNFKKIEDYLLKSVEVHGEKKIFKFKSDDPLKEVLKSAFDFINHKVSFIK